MENLLLQNITKYVSLTKEEELNILPFFEKKTYPSKTILLQPGDFSETTYFVISGLLRSYTIDENGVEHILVFASADWWISDLYSYFGNKPSISYIDTVEASEVFELKKEDLDMLYDKIPKLERFFRILTQNSLVANQQRIIDKMSLTAEMRYEKFIKRYPRIYSSIPQKQIASYIGVTPEFFSKMKSKMLKNQNK